MEQAADYSSGSLREGALSPSSPHTGASVHCRAGGGAGPEELFAEFGLSTLPQRPGGHTEGLGSSCMKLVITLRRSKSSTSEKFQARSLRFIGIF